jgi:hypothetical protein
MTLTAHIKCGDIYPENDDLVIFCRDDFGPGKEYTTGMQGLLLNRYSPEGIELRRRKFFKVDELEKGNKYLRSENTRLRKKLKEAASSDPVIEYVTVNQSRSVLPM